MTSYKKFKVTVISSLLLAICIFSLTSCTKKPDQNTPQGVLSTYVSKTMSLKSSSEKSELEKMTTGEARKTLQNLDEAGFRSYFLDVRREFISMKIRDERALSPERHSITYEISYKSHSPNSDDIVTIKKHALLVKDQNQWLISEVQNLKTNIEHENAISF